MSDIIQDGFPEAEIDMIFLTCDNYSALWPSFFRLFQKYGPKISFHVISTAAQKEFLGNDANLGNLHILPLHCSATATWSERLYLAISRAKHDIVLLVIDDFFLKCETDTGAFCRALEIMKKNKSVAGITFSRPTSRRCRPFPSLNDFEIVNRFCPYRINTQIGLWRKQYLLSIIKRSETAWDYEVCGSFRSTIHKGLVLQLRKDNCPSIFYYDWGFLVRRGHYYAPLADYFVKNEKEDITPFFPEYSETKDEHHTKIYYLLRCVRSLFLR